jgi:hypothetical protein
MIGSTEENSVGIALSSVDKENVTDASVNYYPQQSLPISSISVFID